MSQSPKRKPDEWFPDQAFLQANDSLTKQTYATLLDFADSFAADTHFVQLGPGAFRAQTLFHDFETATLAMDSWDKAHEADELASRVHITVALDYEPAEPVDGCADTTQYISVAPAQCQTLTLQPPKGVLFDLSIDADAWESALDFAPEVHDWFDGLSRDAGTAVLAPNLAAQLRAHYFQAMEAVTATKTSDERATIERALLMGVTSAFALEWIAQQTLVAKEWGSGRSFARFQRVREQLLNRIEELNADDQPRSLKLDATRADEMAFSKHSTLSPIAYSRVVRLNRVRRALMNADRADASIGDLAAEHGFWDWSRFSQYYRKQFGEKPSDTRARMEALRRRRDTFILPAAKVA